MRKNQAQLMGFSSVVFIGLLASNPHTLWNWSSVQTDTTKVELSRSENARTPATTLSIPPKVNRCQNIYTWVCGKKAEINDPTGTVTSDIEGERQSIQIYHQIIKEHHNWQPAQIDEELVKQIYTPHLRNRLEFAFKWVKGAVDRFFERQPGLTHLQKVKLMTILHRVFLQLPPPASNYADEPDLFTKDEVDFERTLDEQLRLRVGGAYLLIAKSWFNLVFTLAHEVAHSVDPCELRHYNLNFPAYNRLKSCFIHHGFISKRNQSEECGPNDQLSEAFADWVAVHVTSEALKVFSTEFHGEQIVNSARNSVRDLCLQEDDKSELDTDFHPPPQIRIGKIFGDNPEIRGHLGCLVGETSPPPYCSFDSLEF